LGLLGREKRHENIEKRKGRREDKRKEKIIGEKRKYVKRLN